MQLRLLWDAAVTILIMLAKFMGFRKESSACLVRKTLPYIVDLPSDLFLKKLR